MPEKMIPRRDFLVLTSALLAVSATGFSSARDRAATDRRKIQVNGLVFEVTITGPEKGRPVLLLHGFPQSAQTWSVVSEGLARHGFRTIAPDQRGYSQGARPTSVSAYTFKAFMADAVGIADALDLNRFDLSGFGMGAALSWMIAAALPDRVRSLTALRFPHPAAITQEYVKRLQEPGALAGALSWHQAVSLDKFARVPAVTVPTLFVWSEGPALTASTAKATANDVNAEYTERFLQDVGHFFLETAPQEIAALLLDQLNMTK